MLVGIEKAFSVLLYIGITIVTLIFAYKIKALRMNQCALGTRRCYTNQLYLAGIFVILFIVSAVRFNVGNDYEQYTKTAHEAFVGGYVVTEPGFNWLVRLVYTVLGGEYYEVVFAIFAFVTLIVFMKAFYEQSEDFFMSFLLFMLLGIYFQTFNTVRYYFALAIVLYGMRYVTGANTHRDFLKFIMLIVIAAFFHKSVLIVIPVFWVAYFPWTKWHILLGTTLCAMCYLFKGPLLQIALVLYPSYRNTVFLDGGGISYGAIGRCIPVLALYVWYLYKYKPVEERELRFYAQLNLLAVAASTFFSFLPVVTRIEYYFSITQLLMIPAIVVRIPEKRTGQMIKTIVVLVCIAYFAMFLWRADQDGVKLIPYNTWIFSNERFTYK